MLDTANKALIQGDYDRLNALLDSVGRVMNNDGHFLDPLAKSYFNVVQTADDLGYEVQQVDVNGDRAVLLVKSVEETNLKKLNFRLNQERKWILSQLYPN